MSVRFIADVNLSPITVQALRAAGYDVIRVTDVLPATTSDAEIFAFAQADNYVVLTQDLDFSALIALGNYGRPSLVTLRLASAQPEEVSKRLLAVLDSIIPRLLEGVAITISDKMVRVRRLPVKKVFE